MMSVSNAANLTYTTTTLSSLVIFFDIEQRLAQHHAEQHMFDAIEQDSEGVGIACGVVVENNHFPVDFEQQKQQRGDLDRKNIMPMGIPDHL